ncbi:MAG: LysM peptidoglycan-binding domain-containing protein, partial [Pseudomonadota bacterium]
EATEPASSADAQLLQPAPGTAIALPADADATDGDDAIALANPDVSSSDDASTERLSVEAPAAADASSSDEDAASDDDTSTDAEAETELSDAGALLYTVQPGDSLSTIAQRFLGNPFRFEEIFRANRNILSNPNLIREGQQLVIPR